MLEFKFLELLLELFAVGGRLLLVMLLALLTLVLPLLPQLLNQSFRSGLYTYHILYFHSILFIAISH